MTRILFLNPTASIGGAERSLLDLMRSLPRDRFEPWLLLPAEGPLCRAGAEAGASVRIVPWPTLLMRTGRERTVANRLLALLAPLLLLPVILRIARTLGRERIDLVHTNGTKAHLGGGLAARMAGVPAVWHLRDVMAAGPLRMVMRLAARLLPTQIIANSRASARALVGDGGEGRVSVVYNGIDLNEFLPVAPGDESPRAALGIPPDAFVVGTLGALAPLKGHVHLIRAMPRLLEAIPSVRVLIVGEEMYATLGHMGHRAALEAEARRLGVAERVIFAGQRSDIVALYCAMDVVALCSVRPESFGRILVEAMACERPVIATDLGGPREIILGPDEGLLIPPGDPEALADAVISLHDDPGRRRRMAVTGRSRVAERFGLELHTHEVCAIYDRILARPAEKAGRNEAEARR